MGGLAWPSSQGKMPEDIFVGMPVRGDQDALPAQVCFLLLARNPGSFVTQFIFSKQDPENGSNVLGSLGQNQEIQQ